MQKIQKFGGAMFTPVLLFAFAGISVGMEQEAKMFVNAPFVIVENDADNSSAEYQAKETG